MSPFGQLRVLALDACRPRLFPIGTAVAIVVLTVAWLEYRLSEHAIRRTPVSVLLSNDRDDMTAVAHRALSTRVEDRPAVAFIGASALREAVVAESPIASMLALHGQGGIRVLRLASSGQSLTESLAILSNASLTPGSVVIFHVSPGRIGVTEAEVAEQINAPRMPFLRFNDLTEHVVHGGIRRWQAPRVVRHRRWLTFYLNERLHPDVRACASLLKRLAGTSCWSQIAHLRWWRDVSGVRDSFYPDVAMSGSSKDSLASLMRLQLSAGAVAPSTVVGASLLRRSADIARARGWHLIFVHLPADPRARALERPRISDEVYALAPALMLGARYVNWLALADFDSDDFYDLHHLRPRGRMKLQAPLGRLILDALGRS